MSTAGPLVPCENEASANLIRQAPEWTQRHKSAHRPLTLPGREIRLMHIEPVVDYSSDLRIRLSVADLDDAPKFYAISLTWGDPSESRKIHLEGAEYMVTVNQEDALRNLRRRPAYQAMPLWMDIICINQTDRQERQLMVGMMDRIFRSSIRTLVWLCESTPLWYENINARVLAKASRRLNGDGTFERCAMRATVDYEPFRQACEKSWLDGALWMAQKLGENPHFWELPFFVEDETGEFGRYKYSRQWYVALRTLEHLYSLPYWSRVWVIQEIALSGQTPEVHIGTRTVPFDLLSGAARNVTSHLTECCASMTPYWMIIHLIPACSAASSLHDQVDRSEPLHVHMAIHASKGCQATDPRDFVYGVLGLVKEWERLPVDYSLSKYQVFAEFQWRKMSSLGTIDEIRYGPSQSRFDSTKPTWLVDYSNPEREHCILSTKNWAQISTRCPVDPADYSCHMTLGLLRAPAHRRDKVYAVRYSGDLPPRWGQEGEFACPDLLQAVQRYRRIVDDGKWTVEVGELWEVLMLGRLGWGKGTAVNHDVGQGQVASFSLGHPFTPAQCARLEGMLNLLRTSPTQAEFNRQGEELDAILKQLYHCLSNGSFFVTKGGRIGLSELNVRPDDEVFELYGCGLPMVLRRWPSDDTSYGIEDLVGEGYDSESDDVKTSQQKAGENDNDYTVVAPCYVSEFMGRVDEDRGLYDQMVTLH